MGGGGGGGGRRGKKEEKPNQTTSVSTNWGSFPSQHWLWYFALLLKLKDRCSMEFLAFKFYLTSGAVDYMAVIFSTHLVAMKCVFFTTTSTREIQLCTLPATQLTLLVNCVRQSVVHAWRFKWKGSISTMHGDLSERGLLAPCMEI